MDYKYWKITMKDIKITDDYVLNKEISEYINKNYNSINSEYSVNTKLLMIIFKKGTANHFGN